MPPCRASPASSILGRGITSGSRGHPGGLVRPTPEDGGSGWELGCCTVCTEPRVKPGVGFGSSLLANNSGNVFRFDLAAFRNLHYQGAASPDQFPNDWFWLGFCNQFESSDFSILKTPVNLVIRLEPGRSKHLQRQIGLPMRLR
jgi:hypothetical protein